MALLPIGPREAMGEYHISYSVLACSPGPREARGGNPLSIPSYAFMIFSPLFLEKASPHLREAGGVRPSPSAREAGVTIQSRIGSYSCLAFSPLLSRGARGGTSPNRS